MSEIIKAWWADDRSNFGDIINEWLISTISGKKAVWTDKVESDETVFICIGSILQFPWNGMERNMVVWGSGAMYGRKKIPKYRKITAVRGPLTAKKLRLKDIPLGDPAILLDRYYTPKSEITPGLIGVIPHYKDKKHKWVQKMSERDDVMVIDIQNPDVFETIDNINKCEYVLSSTLHGLIVADVFNKKSLWTLLSDRVAGSGFKFRDYLSSIGQEYKGIRVDENTEMDSLLSLVKDYTIDESMKDALIEACPFKKG